MNKSPLHASSYLQEQLRKISAPQHISRSSLLFSQGDVAEGVYLVEKGVVCLTLKLYRHGVTLCERKLGEGSLFGLPAVVNGTCYSLTAKALSDLEVAYIPRDVFMQEMSQTPSVAMEVLKILGQEVHDMRERIRTKCTQQHSPLRYAAQSKRRRSARSH